MVNRKDLYKFAYNYLVEQTGDLITREELDAMLTLPDGGTITSLDEALYHAAIILQDYQSMPKIIQLGTSATRQKILKNIFKNFQVEEVSKMDALTVYRALQKVITIKNADSTRNVWFKYVKSVISTAKFLSKYRDLENLLEDLNSVPEKDAVPEMIAQEIFGMGFALACNWLKELGFKYPKPDVHMRKIFNTLGYCEDNDIDCYKTMMALAEENDVDIYTFDKTFWLVCSGNYYRYGKKLNKKPEALRNQFIIEALKK